MDIHFLILKGISTKDAGVYRVKPVGVRKSNGKIYNFTQPLKIQDELDSFISWLKESQDLHPIILASEVHLRFVSIHPFIDGNGRTARLLMNLILLQYGYPLAVIKMVNRAEYILSIEKTQDSGQLDDFYTVVADAVNENLDTYLDILSRDIELI